MPSRSQRRSRNERAAKRLPGTKVPRSWRIDEMPGRLPVQHGHGVKSDVEDVGRHVDFAAWFEQFEELAEQILANPAPLALAVLEPWIGEIDEKAAHVSGRKEPRQVHRHISEHAANSIEAFV